MYLAEQDEPVKRQVALKVLRSEFSASKIEQRFESERQALAGLEHPHIATLFDAGRTDDGIPYFAMEAVLGLSITDYCRREGLSVAARIRLFVGVCRGVQHAHLKGLIHRDLKPENILVTDLDGRAVPKVIDFGIAKIIDTDLVAELTTRGEFLGSPAYMSPEQAAGAVVDSRVDVYGLGAVLFELLTDALPVDLEGVALAAAPYAIRERPVRKPSEVARLSGAAPSHELHPDLDAILAKALSKQPDDRYDTVNEFADDLSRFLANRPVAARRQTSAYVLRRFIGRNKALVSVSIAAIGALLVTSGIALRQSAQARIEAVTAQATTDFLVDLFAVTDPWEAGPGAKPDEVSAREVLRRGADRIETTFESEPVVRADLLQAIGSAYQGIGAPADAIPLLEHALEIRRASDSSDAGETLYALALSAYEVADFENAAARSREAAAMAATAGDELGRRWQ